MNSARVEPPVAVLIVEDDESTAELEKRVLVRSGRSVLAVGSVTEALDALNRQEFLAVLLDYRLPDGEPWIVLEAAQNAVPRIPVILVTAMGDERVAAEVLHRGGADYLIKTPGFWDHLPASLDRVVRLNQAEQAKERLAALVESSDDAIVSASVDGRVLSWNPGAERLFGYSAEEIIGQKIQILVPPDRRAEGDTIQNRVRAGETTRQLETVRSAKDGTLVDVSTTVSAIFDPVGRIVGSAIVSRDITKRKQAERRLALQHTVSQSLAASTTPAEAGPDVLEALCEGLGWKAGRIWLAAKEGKPARCEALWGDRAATADWDRAVRFPMIVGERTLGSIDLHDGEARGRDDESIRLISAIAGQMGQFIDRWLTSRALIESEARHRMLFDGNPLAMWLYDRASLAILSVNDAAIAQYGYSREEFLTMTLKDVRPPEEIPRLIASHEAEAPVAVHAGVWRHKRKNGDELLVDVRIQDLVVDGSRLRLASLQDVTDQKRIEEQLLQSQKMDAIGQLAGGIAHDFNNLLMVLWTYADRLPRDFGDAGRLRSDADEIISVVERGAAMTKQLLTFSKKQVVRSEPLEPAAVIADLAAMLQRVIGENIDFRVSVASDLGYVLLDRSQLEQILMNLVLNARDAMPSGGRLSVKVDSTILDESYPATHPGVRPGAYVQVTVADSGIGMDSGIRSRIFEPFFTTKEKDKGTGLGLATVYGIVKSIDGDVWVYSETGKGSVFKVYLPRIEGNFAKPRTRKSAPTPVSSKFETILLLEDDDVINLMASEYLRSRGYRVLAARDGNEAIRLASDHAGGIGLLVSDVIVPGRPPMEVAELLVKQNPSIKVLFMSGYAENDAIRGHVTSNFVDFLQKPFALDTLARKIRTILGEPGEIETSVD